MQRRRTTLSKLLMVSNGVQKLGHIDSIFLKSGVKIYGTCFRDKMKQQLVPTMHHTSADMIICKLNSAPAQPAWDTAKILKVP